MRHILLATVWSFVLGSGYVRLAWCAAAPPVPPTSVLPPPAASLVRAGRYHSLLAAYSVVSAWPGHPVIEGGVSYDLFEGGHAAITVQTAPNTSHLDSRGVELRLCGTITHWGMLPTVVSRRDIAGQHRIALLAFAGMDGVFAAVTFVALHRVWILQLSSTYARQEQDWHIFTRFLSSFRLEVHQAGTRHT